MQPSAAPQPTPVAPISGVHRHDGFFLRLTLGPGAGAVGLDAKRASDDTAFAGLGWASSLDIGGSNGDNLAIFGRLRHASIANSVVYVDDDEVEDADATLVSQSMVGVGISYFIMPLNLYLGAAVGLAVVSGSYKRPNRETLQYDSKVGFGLDAEVGKEWWIADDWGLGVAARFSFADAIASDDLPDDARFGGAFVSLLLSVTYQ